MSPFNHTYRIVSFFVPSTLARKDPDVLVKAIILWRIPEILNGYSLLAQGQLVSLSRKEMLKRARQL